MNTRATARLDARMADAPVGAEAVLEALPDCVLVVGEDGRIESANAAAEAFFEASRAWLCARRLDDLLPADSPLQALVAQALAGPGRVSEYGVILATPRIGEHFVSIQAVPLADRANRVVVTLHEQSMARQIDRQLSHRGAARTVTAMAAMLAHEVKNPLSGIRGAAQLLEDGLDGEDRLLTRLICEETDRICALVDDMEVFADQRPVARVAVNIHEVLDHVRRLAEVGFGRGITFSASYDPSLPPVHGNRDQLIQVVLNLVKNACEAAPADGGEVRLATEYRHGVRLARAGGDTRLALPLMVTIQDNGEGVPDDLRACLFDPFVTSRAGGKGLGLALVAKIVNDHGGAIAFDSEPRRTTFRLLLPAAPTGEDPL